MWTSPSEQPAPFGTCGQTVDNRDYALPTACPHSLASRPHTHRHNNKFLVLFYKTTVTIIMSQRIIKISTFS
jgi:hypothetical protein